VFCVFDVVCVTSLGHVVFARNGVHMEESDLMHRVRTCVRLFGYCVSMYQVLKLYGDVIGRVCVNSGSGDICSSPCAF
jgi:hypothetical protein